MRENGRVVFMFRAFAGPPKIVRFHGAGEVVTPTSPAWDALHGAFPADPAARAIILVGVQRVSDSCGYGIPELAFVQDRDAMKRWAETRGLAAPPQYRRDMNSHSIDGLPALDPD
ncbi:MAG: hypothetical protein LH617_14610 [Ramlibacter sp.]|nr:hypothetical protein [Ramlibacter sp.]